jgi:hypothetical protein
MIDSMAEQRDFWAKVVVVTGLIAALAAFGGVLKECGVKIPPIERDRTAIDPPVTPQTESEPSASINSRDHTTPDGPKNENVRISQHPSQLVGKVSGRPGYCRYRRESGDEYTGRCPAQ